MFLFRPFSCLLPIIVLIISLEYYCFYHLFFFIAIVCITYVKHFKLPCVQKMYSILLSVKLLI